MSLGAVNILGGLGAGIVMSLYAQESIDFNMRLFVLTGLLGGFTTFSAFSMEVYELMHKAQYLMALGFVICVFFGSVLGVYLGHKL